MMSQHTHGDMLGHTHTHFYTERKGYGFHFPSLSLTRWLLNLSPPSFVSVRAREQAAGWGKKSERREGEGEMGKVHSHHALLNSSHADRKMSSMYLANRHISNRDKNVIASLGHIGKIFGIK